MCLFLNKKYDNYNVFKSEFDTYCSQNWCQFQIVTNKINKDQSIQYDFVHFKCIYHNDPNKMPTKDRKSTLTQNYYACNCPLEIRRNRCNDNTKTTEQLEDLQKVINQRIAIDKMDNFDYCNNETKDHYI